MPVLRGFIGHNTVVDHTSKPEPAIRREGLQSIRQAFLSTCANPRCSTGWLKTWRSRTSPMFEGGWCCNLECTMAQIAVALRREIEMLGHADALHHHRVPLGLVMLDQGWITAVQLREALAMQRSSGAGRIGQWLVRRHGVNEYLVTRALSLQWGCPVLSLDGHEAESVSAFLPRLFVDAFGALPLRSAAGKLLYVGFEDRVDPLVAFAIERMTDLRVECGLVQDTLFQSARERILQARFPRVELIEAVTEQVLVQELARRVERERATDCRLVRVHDCFWLRIWKRPQRGPLPDADAVQDVICSLNAGMRSSRY